MRGFRDRTEVVDVLRLIDKRVTALPPETVPLADAAGRVLLKTCADVAVPLRPGRDGWPYRCGH